MTDLAAHKLAMPSAIAKLPAAIRRQITTQCQGDWRRVTIDPDGSITVHNKPQFTRVELPAQKAPVKRVAKPPARPAPKPSFQGRTDTTEVVSAGPAAPPPSRPSTPVNPFRAAARIPLPPQREVISRRPVLSTPLPPIRRNQVIVEDAPAVVAVHAAELARQMAKGIPTDVAYQIHDNVLSMFGVDFEILDDAVRSPTSVEIAPETYEKGYTILRFRRADVLIVVGFREVHEPVVLAHYATGSITGARGGPNIGAFKAKPKGLPRSPGQMLAKFVAMGARCERNPSGQTASVYMGEQHLGSVTIDRMAAAQTVSADFIRIIRKIKAIQSSAEAG